MEFPTCDENVLSKLECGICFNKYESRNFIPMSLKCGHTYCKLCIDKLISRSPECPVCRENISQTHPVKNYALLDLISNCEKEGNDFEKFTTQLQVLREELNSEIESLNKKSQILTKNLEKVDNLLKMYTSTLSSDPIKATITDIKTTLSSIRRGSPVDPEVVATPFLVPMNYMQMSRTEHIPNRPASFAYYEPWETPQSPMSSGSDEESLPTILPNSQQNFIPDSQQNFIPDSQQIFISNIPHNIDEQDLMSEFSKYGDIQEIQIKRRRGRWNQPSNFGFVAFDNEESVKLCLSLRPIYLGASLINVERKRAVSEVETITNVFEVSRISGRRSRGRMGRVDRRMGRSHGLNCFRGRRRGRYFEDLDD